MTTPEARRHAAERRAAHGRAKLGMWVFLVTEVVFFAGLFLLYAAYRTRYPADFAAAARHLHPAEGAANTLVLLTSSATMALGVSALQRGRVRPCVRFLAATLALGAVFLAVKSGEWSALIDAGFYPGSPDLAGLGHGQVLFCSLYFLMTGLHALHVLAGLALIGTAVALALEGRLGPQRTTLAENAGLFWHLVDGVWIYLWPLLYLVS